MLLLAMTCVRSDRDEEALQMVRRGELAEAMSLVRSRLERRPTIEGAAGEASLGQVIGRVLIELGREEEAEELFKRQQRVYEMDSRQQVRWMSSLDHGALQLMLNRPGRAADTFNAVADDETAPVGLRIEAFAGLAVGARGLGEYRRALRVLSYAESVAQRQGLTTIGRLLQALMLETAAIRRLRAFDEGETPDEAPIEAVGIAPDVGGTLSQRLLDASREFDDVPIAAQRLRFLSLLVDARLATPAVATPIFGELNRLRLCKLWGYEKQCRLEASLAHGAHGDVRLAHELLGGLAHDEQAIDRHRYSLELKYCLSRVYSQQGRHVDALRLYKEHVAQTLTRLHTELVHLPYSRCIDKQEMAEQADATKMLLPLRYRRAYQYIIDHLDDRDLNVRAVATHIDVTERALQMAFRHCLGTTPAELIRRRRLERIRKELRETTDRRSVLEIAQRWGMSNRSTLAQNYRRFFNETPTTARQGRLDGDGQLA